MLYVPKESPQIQKYLKLVKEEGYSHDEALKAVGADYIDEQEWEYFGFNQREGDYRDYYDFRHPPREVKIKSYSKPSPTTKWDYLKNIAWVLGWLLYLVFFAYVIYYGLLWFG